MASMQMTGKAATSSCELIKESRLDRPGSSGGGGETRVRDVSNRSRSQTCCGSTSALCIQPHLQRLRTTV